MKLKKGITLQGARPELVIALQVVGAVYHHFNEMAVITSMLDGTHSKNSLHYAGQATRISTRDIEPAKIRLIVEEIRDRLTGDFDVILEQTHLHIKYQPRKH